MKVHFLYGCSWADGSIQMADTDQTCYRHKVTCKQCLRLMRTGYGRERRAERFDWDAITDTVKPEYTHYYD